MARSALVKRQLSEGDLAIFARLKKEKDPRIFANYYLRSPGTGTWWRFIHQSQINQLTIPGSIEAAHKWRDGYSNLKKIWLHLGKPDFFGPNGDDWIELNESMYNNRVAALQRCYRVVYEDDNDQPSFHHSHGVMPLPWGLEKYRSKQLTRVLIGGYGSGKSMDEVIDKLIKLATVPGYEALYLTPNGFQGTVVHNLLMQIISGTQYEEKFLVKTGTRPNPYVVIGNEEVGFKNTLYFLPLDKPEKILTASVDEITIDQAESFGNLDAVIRDVGTRLRGQVKGRPRIGRITMLANAEDNPILWDWFDEAVESPERVWSLNPGTYDNFYLTVQNLIEFESRVGKDEQSRRVHLGGERPIGSGEHFSSVAIEKCRDRSLDTIMTESLDKGLPGWRRIERKKIGVHIWERPYDPAGTYVTVADPGTANPPERNSPCIMVYRIDGFPTVKARLWAFWWDDGMSDPNVWMAQYIHYCGTYNCLINGFDSTGFQKGYGRVPDMARLGSNLIDMSGTKKYELLNLAKKAVNDALFAWPSISMMFSQMTKYRLPDDKLRQDIVAAFLVLIAILEPYLPLTAEEADEVPYFDYEDDRYARRLEDRFERTA